jgi:hypothetical protein
LPTIPRGRLPVPPVVAAVSDYLASIKPTTGDHVPVGALQGLDEDSALHDVLATESGSLHVSDEDALILCPPRSLQYPRDPADRLRVVVDSLTMPALVAGTANIGRTSLNWAQENAYTTYYAAGAPGSMDAREQHKELAHQSFQNECARWTFS